MSKGNDGDRVHRLGPGEKNFIFIVDDFPFTRASVEIAQNCPPDIREIIQHAIKKNWLKPIAYVKESELLMTTLRGE